MDTGVHFPDPQFETEVHIAPLLAVLAMGSAQWSPPLELTKRSQICLNQHYTPIPWVVHSQ